MVNVSQSFDVEIVILSPAPNHVTFM